VCDISDEVRNEIKAFRFQKQTSLNTNSALISKYLYLCLYGLISDILISKGQVIFNIFNLQ